MLRLLIALIIVLASAAIAIPHAIADKAVYRWVDADGIAHFADRAPEGVNAMEVTLKPSRVEVTSPEKSAGPSPDPETAADAVDEAEPSFAEQSRQFRAERRAKYIEDRQKMASQCEAMRRQRDFVEPSPRVLVQDDDGITRRLEDGEREELLNKANAFLAANCN